MGLFYKVLLCAIINVGSWSWVEGNLFTAIASMEPLLQTQHQVIKQLDDYICKEEQRLAVVKRTLMLFKKEHSKAMTDVPNYLGNPLNTFTLIKRLTSDVQQIKQSVNYGAELINNVTENPELIYPTDEDLAGAATALVRLQDTYELNVTELSDGNLNNITYSTPLTSSDCFELGKALFHQDDFINSLLWMKQALRKYRREDQPQIHLTEIFILEYISMIYSSQGDIKNAIEWTKNILKLYPTHTKARLNLIHYEKKSKEMAINATIEISGAFKKIDDDIELVLYEALCRGDIDIAKDISKRLKCRYLQKENPFLLLAPFKVEQLYIEQDIYLYHDVISDNEIEYLKDTATPKLKRSEAALDGVKHAVNYRISMNAWLADEESSIAARLSRRVSHMTGLDTTLAERLQIGNYGIGGHYVPHYDFSIRYENDPNNRIATVMFYMSSVAQGGATVFTELGLSVFPVKGAAVFWMNLHPSGEGDLATRHAACPVLRGSKWVSNKWICQSGQELLKPCDMEYQDEGFKRKLPSAILKKKIDFTKYLKN